MSYPTPAASKILSTIFSAMGDGDYLAMGRVVAKWSIAEMLFRNGILCLYFHPDVAATDLPRQNIHDFRRKQEVWKKCVRLACAKHDEYVNLGLFLAGRGKALKTARDKACHWPASRAIPTASGVINMFDPTNLDSLAAEYNVQHTSASLSQLADDIGKWGAAVGLFTTILSFDVLSAPSPHTATGPRPDWVLESLRSYRKIR
jgi:hypothetical protein